MVRLARNPDGPNCYGRSNSAMVQWISNFSDSVRQKVGRYPVIATTAQWWKECTGNSTDFTEKNPLFIIRHTPPPGSSRAGGSTTRSGSTATMACRATPAGSTVTCPACSAWPEADSQAAPRRPPTRPYNVIRCIRRECVGTVGARLFVLSWGNDVRCGS
ncbi:GH25 family lysozyme [Streptomyces sp. ISL-99]|uniref:GH25 family lysozyme n=1 Tax=Streptomyces sp. ISL-99 TaxID=2819193 RepID=UPI0035B07360